jgi:hypothetical protein
MFDTDLSAEYALAATLGVPAQAAYPGRARRRPLQ